MKLENIFVNKVYHPNIFFYKNTDKVEVIDVLLTMDYEVDEDKLDLKKYRLARRDLEEKRLDEILKCYVCVVLKEDADTKLDEIDYKDLEYLVISDDFEGNKKDAKKHLSFILTGPHLEYQIYQMCPYKKCSNYLLGLFFLSLSNQL